MNQFGYAIVEIDELDARNNLVCVRDEQYLIFLSLEKAVDRLAKLLLEAHEEQESVNYDIVKVDLNNWIPKEWKY